MNFDNGPRDGDFVRYIDELAAGVAARAAVKPAATTIEVAAQPTPRTPAVRPPARANPAPAAAAVVGTLVAAQLFTLLLFVVGAVMIGVGFFFAGLDAMLALGIGLVAWGVRRTATRKQTA